MITYTVSPDVYINPIAPAAHAFHIIWNHVPMPVRSIFYVALLLVVVYALYRLLSR